MKIATPTQIVHAISMIALCFLLLNVKAQPVKDRLRLVYDEKAVTSEQSGVTVSKDGKKIAFAYDDRSVKIYDAERSRVIKTFRGPIHELWELRFTHDGTQLIWVTKDQEVILLDVKSGKETGRFRVSQEISRVAVGPGLLAIGQRKGILTIFDLKSQNQLHEFDLEKHHIGGLSFSNDGKFVAAASVGGTALKPSRAKIFNLRTGEIAHTAPKSSFYVAIHYTKNGEIIVGRISSSVTIERWDLSRNKLESYYKKGRGLNVLDGAYSNIMLKDNKLIGVTGIGSFDVIDAQTGKKIYTTLNEVNDNVREAPVGFAGFGTDIKRIYPLFDGKHFIINTSDSNITQIFNSETGNISAFIFSDKEHLAVAARDGKMDGDPGAISKVYWSERKSNRRVSLESTFDQFYTPGLLSQMLGGSISVSDERNLENLINLAPTVSILSPDSISSVSTSTITVRIKAEENGDAIEKYRIFVNDKLVNEDTRGFKAGIQNEIALNVLPGRNVIQAVAISKAGYQSLPDQVIINYRGQTAAANMHIVAVGINEYKNPRYNLNYANADAQAFIDHLKANGQGIFKSINTEYIQDDQATKSNVVAAFNKLVAIAQPQDVFVFYYAGHGVMSEGIADVEPDFHLALHDITQMYGRDDMLALYGISAAELRELSKKISAQKQLIVLDACQSGGAVETFARRGAAEEKAILQLARSAGTVLLASTGSEQFATEFEQLGHGVFTYSLLEGFQGKADGSSGDKKITVKELESYLNDRIPELTQQYKGTVQYPMSWSRGQDFPVTVVK